MFLSNLAIPANVTLHCQVMRECDNIWGKQILSFAQKLSLKIFNLSRKFRVTHLCARGAIQTYLLRFSVQKYLNYRSRQKRIIITSLTVIRSFGPWIFSDFARLHERDLKLTKLAVLLQHWLTGAPSWSPKLLPLVRIPAVHSRSITCLLVDGLLGVRALCQDAPFWWILPVKS